MSQFLELFNYALNLVNYATKSDLKNVTGVDTWEFGKKFI